MVLVAALKGLAGYLADTGKRPVIICEVAPRAYSLTGGSPAELWAYMRAYNYRAFSLVDTDAEVDITKLQRTADVVFISWGASDRGDRSG